MKLIISSSFVFKYVTEYLNTFEGYIPDIYDNLFNYNLSECEELILVQWEIWKWLPKYIFKLPLKLSILNTEQLVYPQHKNNLISNLEFIVSNFSFVVILFLFIQII